MIEDYRVYLENLSFSSFLQLTEAMGRTNEFVRKTLNSTLMIIFVLKKTPMILAVEKNKELRLQIEESALQKKRNQTIPILSSFPYRAKRATSLLEQWIKDNAVHFPEVEFLASIVDLKDP